MTDPSTMERLLHSLQARAKARLWRERHHPNGRLKPRNDQNAAIARVAIERGELDPGVEYWITYTPMREESLSMREHSDPEIRRITADYFDPDALNGYVAFPKRRSPVKADDPRLIYIPVHGGVTYAKKDGAAAVFGFDTLHASSELIPRLRVDPVWIRKQCNLLYHGLQLLALEDRRKRSRASHLEYAEAMQRLGDEGEELNFGLVLALLGGKLP